MDFDEDRLEENVEDNGRMQQRIPPIQEVMSLQRKCEGSAKQQGCEEAADSDPCWTPKRPELKDAQIYRSQ